MRNRTATWLLAILLCLVLIRPASPLSAVVTAQESSQSRPLDIVLVLDQSGSMFLYSDPGVPEKNDAGNITGYKSWPIRQIGASYFVDFLAIEHRQLDHQVGIVYFGSQAEVVEELFSVTDTGRREQVIDSLYQVPPDLKWTNTNAALEAAYSELFESERHSPEHQPVVILLSDGHPELADNWLEEDTSGLPGKRSYYQRHQELVGMFKDRGVPLYSIIIAKEGTSGIGYVDEQDPYLAQHPELGNYANIWQQAARETGGEYYRVKESADEIMDVYHAILSRYLGLSALGRPIIGPILNEPQTILIPVGQCTKMIVTVEKTSPEAQIELQAPDGGTVSPDVRRPQYELYTIRDPEEGTWSLKLGAGSGSYRIRLDCEPTELQCNFLAPPTTHPLCKPMDVQVRCVDETGVPVTGALAGVEVALPDGGSEQLTLDSRSEGLYDALFENATQEGGYKLSLTVHHEGRQISAEKPVTVIQQPYLAFVEPIPDTPHQYPGGDVLVQAALKVGCDPIRDDPMLSGRDSRISARLEDGAGTPIGPTALLDGGEEPDLEGLDGIFSGVLQGVAPGEYTLTIEMSNEPRQVRDVISGRVTFGEAMATPPPTDTPTPTPTPSPVYPPIWVAPDPAVVKAGDLLELWVHVNGQDLDQPQSLGLVLVGEPFGQKQEQISARPGDPDSETRIDILIPKERDPGREGLDRQTYPCELQVTYPDQTTASVPFEVQVLPPLPIVFRPEVLLAIFLGLVALGAGIFAVFRFMGGKGRLTGTLVYVTTPAIVGNLPDEVLSGHKHTVVLHEEAPLGGPYPPPSPPSSASPDDTAEASFEDITFDDLPPLDEALPAEPESLHTELTFTARRGQTEARVAVTATNTTVLIANVQASQGDPPYQLRDGETISAGGYTLRYESLSYAEPDTVDDLYSDQGYFEEESFGSYDEFASDGFSGYDGDTDTFDDLDASYGTPRSNDEF